MVLPKRSFMVMVAGSVVGSCRLKVPLVGLGIMVKVRVLANTLVIDVGQNVFLTLTLNHAVSVAQVLFTV